MVDLYLPGIYSLIQKKIDIKKIAHKFTSKKIHEFIASIHIDFLLLIIGNCASF